MEEYNMGSNVQFFEDDTTCSVCCAEFLDTNDLSTHIIQIHLKESTLNRYCSVCRKFFRDIEEFALHLKTYHIRSLRWCKYCTRVFFNKKDLREHEKKHGEWKNKSCSCCDKTFMHQDVLAAHEFNNHFMYKEVSEGIFLQESFPLLSAFLHMNVKKFFTVQYTHESYKCISCRFVTSDLNNFLQHIETERKKTFVCNKCCQVFRAKRDLYKHIKMSKCSNNLEWSECGVCEKRIDNKSFETHTKQCVRPKYASGETDLVTQKSVSILHCAFCKKMIVGNVALNKHINRVHKRYIHLYKYKCVECDVPFLHPKYLFRHYYSIHKRLQPYTCNICNKKYRVRKSFTLHIKVDHKSVGFVEFDKDYKVFFTDKKSENPFQPYPVMTEYLENKTLNKDEMCKDYIQINLTRENSDFIDGSETECESDADRNEMLNKEQSETECETDDNLKRKPIPLADKETECGTDIDKLDNNETLKQSKYTIEVEIDCGTNSYKNYKNVNSKPTRCIKNELDSENNVDKKRKTPKNEKKRVKSKQRYYSTEDSSDDSDVPLIEMTRRKNLGSSRRRRNHQKFICLKCKKNCYTFQNYNHHMSLHDGCELKKCIKCQKKFKSKTHLEVHMKRKHASSKLTETLKHVLERRKNNTHNINDPQILRENLKRTVHKVNIPEDISIPAVLKMVDDGLSAKSFIESFTPEGNSKEIKVTSSITIKEIRGSYIHPMIKMTKFQPDPPTVAAPKLRMPVKFKKEKISHVKAKVKVLQKPMISKQQITFTKSQEDGIYPSESDACVDDREEIPDVAEEVLLNTEEKEELREPHNMISQNSIIIPNFPGSYDDVKIGHLQPQAPYYKIVSMKDVMNTTPQKIKPTPSTGPVNVTLPDGMKLVSVNPLAHLLGNTNVEKILQPNKHYLPKVKDIKSAMEKAMKKAYQPKKRHKIV